MRFCLQRLHALRSADQSIEHGHCGQLVWVSPEAKAARKLSLFYVYAFQQEQHSQLFCRKQHPVLHRGGTRACCYSVTAKLLQHTHLLAAKGACMHSCQLCGIPVRIADAHGFMYLRCLVQLVFFAAQVYNNFYRLWLKVRLPWLRHKRRHQPQNPTHSQSATPFKICHL